MRTLNARRSSSSDIIDVDTLNDRVRATIHSSPELASVAVRGELQNFKLHSSGHAYFSLLGTETRVACVMFRSSASNVLTWPQDGDEVLVTGTVDVYTKGGTYQIYADRLLPIGVGAQARAREETMRTLAADGIFDISQKRPVPQYPSKVAIVTSDTGAAVRDILKVSLNRAPFVDIIIVPTLVQGITAPDSIVRSLAMCGTLSDTDCVILARGGGAREDLSPFDDERVARAIRSCSLPVVTGIGHQINTSIADMAADAACATPSAAAERVFPDSYVLLNSVDSLGSACNAYVLRLIGEIAEELQGATADVGRDCLYLFRAAENNVDHIMDTLASRMTYTIDASERDLTSIAAILNASSPLALLARGYAICTKKNGTALVSKRDAEIGDNITIRLSDGSLSAQITE